MNVQARVEGGSHSVQGTRTLGELPASQQGLFADVRKVIEEVQVLLHEAQPSRAAECVGLLEQIDQPFSLFVCGEFNAGKSSLINAAAGARLAETGVLPTTREISPLSSGSLLFVDSPGTNSIIAEHQEITERYLRRADFVVFVTSVERPLTESELRFLREIRDRWSRRVVVVINKCDLHTPEEIDAVTKFVRTSLSTLLEEEFPLFCLSSRTGQGVQEFIDSLSGLLTHSEQVRTKLRAPLSSLEVFLDEVSATATTEITRLNGSLAAIDQIVKRCESRVTEAMYLFEGFFAQGQTLFSELSWRFTELVDAHLGLVTLLKAKLSGNTERYQGRIFELLNDIRFEARIDALVGDVSTRLSTHREVMLAEMREFLSSLDAKQGEVQLPAGSGVVNPQTIAEDLRRAAERGLNRFFALGSAAAASGLGAKVSTVAPLEISAVILMVSLGFLTFRVLPLERRKLKSQVEESFSELGTRFADVLREATRAHLTETVTAIEQTLAPQRNEMAGVLSTWRSTSERANELRARLHRLAAEVDLRVPSST